MSTYLRRITIGALAALPLALAPGAASADHANGGYTATLAEINDSGGSGMFSLSIDGDQATVELSWSGLAAEFDGGPYPHVQHIHIGGEGVCPTQDLDANGDGIVNTPEGASAYGAVGTTLSLSGSTGPGAATDISVAPGGGSTTYSRTFTMNQKTLDAISEGTGVVVVHGLNPADLSQEAQDASSPLVPELPQAATAPALCGALRSMPAGGVAAGAGDASGGAENLGMIGVGAGLALAGGATLALRRRQSKPEGASV